MFCFMRISLVLEVNKTVVVCNVHATNEERKGNWILVIKWTLVKACLGNPLRSKDTIEVFFFSLLEALSHFDELLLPKCVWDRCEMLRVWQNAIGAPRLGSLEEHSWVFLFLHWIAKKTLLLGTLLGEAAWGAEGVLVFLPLLVGFKSAFLQAPLSVKGKGMFSLLV